MINNWLKIMEAVMSVSSVFFDIRKAFDSVLHLLLVQKLQSAGLHSYLVRWLCDYLQGRTQECCSHWGYF